MLQGSLENFSLDEVLGLLSNTSKTGRLEITGDRGIGALYFDKGSLVGASANSTPNGNSSEDIMFELLRFKSGDFVFSAEEVEGTEDKQEMTSVLKSAKVRLADWRSIEAVVPTLAHIVTPIPELKEDSVTVNKSEWAALNVIAAGCPISLVCEELGLGEVEGSRRIKELADRSLVVIGEPLGGARPLNAPATPPPVEEPVEGEFSGGHGHNVEAAYEAQATTQAAPAEFDTDDFDASTPPSLAGIGDFSGENGASNSNGGILKRYLSSDE